MYYYKTPAYSLLLLVNMQSHDHEYLSYSSLKYAETVHSTIIFVMKCNMNFDTGNANNPNEQKGNDLLDLITLRASL